jgi:hypothetical protein
MIILELGSGNAVKTVDDAAELIEAVAGAMGERRPVLKFQLFQEEPPNKPLKRGVFEFAHDMATDLGFPVTASVFSADDMDFLLNFDVPFVKIACRPKLYPLAKMAHARGVKTVVSYQSPAEMGKNDMVIPLCCIPHYPASRFTYEQTFPSTWLTQGISDHTEGFELYQRFQPEWYEKHVVLKRSKKNPDAGPFACLVSELVALYE